jgi:maltose/moltooligosaccharide transporter
LIQIARKLGAKRLHFVSLAIGGTALLCMPLLNDTDLLFTLPFGDGIPVSQIYLFSFGLGITWASMMAMPYEMLAASIPKGKTGVYMGIFNMFIVVPMIIQIFSVQYFVYDVLGQNPINIIRLAGVFLIIGGIFSLFVSQPKSIKI